jgi:arylsulfatase
MEGVSLAPAFCGESLDRPNPIFWEHEGNRAVRDDKWKLVAKENQPWELYDMDADRTEMHDLSAEQPELATELAAKWDAWAERAYVLPLGAWRGKQKAMEFNEKQKRFELKLGDDLPREKAPFVEGKALTIAADIAETTADGVIVAQGGSADGFALYVKDGQLTFATRHGGTLAKVVANDNLPAVAAKIQVSFSVDGAVTISVDGQPFARGKVSGPLARMPIDGLQIGSDLKGAVGEYEAPFAYKGKIESVTLEIQK